MANKLIKGNELHLYGAVGGDITWGEDGLESTGFTDEQVNSALAEMSGDIVLRLNSAGGIAVQGIAIYNALKTYAGKVTVYIDALAASAASLIAMAGDTIIMRTGSLLMIHDPSTITFGTSGELRKTADVLDEVAAAAAEIYAERSGQSNQRVRALMADETWMRGDLARKLGFADRLDDEAATMAAPVFKYTLFKHAPAELLAPAAIRAAAAPGNTPANFAATERVIMTSSQMAANPAAPASFRDATDDIFSRCRSAKLTMDETNEIMLAAAGNAEKARDLIIDMIAARDPAPNMSSHLAGGYGAPSAGMEKDITDALVMKFGSKAPGASINALQLSERSMTEIGRSYLMQAGAKIGGASDKTIVDMMMGGYAAGQFGGVGSIVKMGGTHTISDFPNLFGSAMYRAIMERFRIMSSPLKQLSLQRNAIDFRPVQYVRPGEAPLLEKVVEGASINYGTTNEETIPQFIVETYAKMFAISRQMIINDDLGAFTDFIRAFADAAAGTENALFFALLSANSYGGMKLNDGKNLFHADHGNKAASGALPSVATLSAARLAMRTQKNVNGKATAGVVPLYLVVGPALETTAQQVVAEINATKTEDVNPFSGQLEVMVENQYSGNGWWLFGDPTIRPPLIHGYLNGATGPVVESRDGWNVLGREFRCVLDFGCSVYDWRSAYFNPGA